MNLLELTWALEKEVMMVGVVTQQAALSGQTGLLTQGAGS